MKLIDLQEVRLTKTWNVVWAESLPYIEMLEEPAPFIDTKTNVLVLSADPFRYTSRGTDEAKKGHWSVELAGDKRSIKKFLEDNFPNWKGVSRESTVWADKDVIRAASAAKRI